MCVFCQNKIGQNLDFIAAQRPEGRQQHPYMRPNVNKGGAYPDHVIRVSHVIRVGGLLQPGHIWGDLGNVLQVDLHTLQVCLNAVAALGISLQDYTRPRMSTNTHICHKAKLLLPRCSAAEWQPAGGPRSAGATLTAFVQQVRLHSSIVLKRLAE